MARAAVRVNRFMGLCVVLAAMCGCAALQKPEHPHTPAADVQSHPVVPAAPTLPTGLDEQPQNDSLAPDATNNTASTPPSASTLDLLRFVEEYAELSPEAQRQTVVEAETRHNVEQTSFTLVRYALLLTLTAPERQTDANTVSDLRDFLARPTPGYEDKDLIPLAHMLVHVLDEREHLLAQNAELQRKLNQLKAIEQKLGDRDGVETPPPAP